MTKDRQGATCGKMRSSVCAAALFGALIALPGAVAAQSECDFFSGQTVELIVPFNPGGGFDAYGRLVAKHMGPILGAENMIVRNQPGAGGMLATNQTWTADPDGLLLQVMSTSGMLTAEIGGAAGVGFKSAEFSWIGRVSGEPDVVAVGFESDIDSPEAIQDISAERTVRIGSSGVGDIDYVEAQILTKIFDLDAEIIVGFSGAPEVYASLARGELDVFTSSYSGARQAQSAELGRILWLFDDNADPDFPDLTPLGDFVEGDNLALVKAHADLVAGGRAIAGPPGIPADRLACLRDAFDATMQDEAFLAESTEIKRPVAPISGSQLQETIVNLTANVPQDYADLLKESYAN